MTPLLTNPRDVAVSALGDRAGNVSARLDRLLEAAELSPADRALARELALGACRRRATLQAVLRAFLEAPHRRLPGAVEEVLLVGLYQLLFLDRVPAFAAVNEAVEQAARLKHRRQGGLVNGVLRNIARALSPAQEGDVPAESDVVPVGPGSFRRIDRPVFPAAGTDPAGYLASAWSLPEPLARRWLERFGSLAAAVAVASHAAARAPLVLRVNRLKTDLAGAAAALAAEDVEAVGHTNGMSLVLAEPQSVTPLRAFREGLIQPQDATATDVVVAADPRPGMNVLDFCAAPGTKTTHLAERMGNRGTIAAVDVSEEKLHRITDNCARLGVTIVSTCLAEQAPAILPERGFDLVLADVPCSNTGVLARRAEARWRFDEERLAGLVADQRFLAAAASQFVRPGGTLVYSTCSIEPEENSQVAQALVRRQKRMELVREELVLPSGQDNPTRWHDGGYYAIFRAH